jgi:hypothetical protein
MSAQSAEITYPSESKTIWLISTKVNKPENDDSSLFERVSEPFDIWAPVETAECRQKLGSEPNQVVAQS